MSCLNVNGACGNSLSILGQSCNYPKISLINSNNLKYGTVIPTNKYYNGGLLSYNLRASGNGNLVHIGGSCNTQDLSAVYLDLPLDMRSNEILNLSKLTSFNDIIIDSCSNIILSNTSVNGELTVNTINDLNLIKNIPNGLNIDGLLIPTRIDFSNNNIRIGKDTGLINQGFESIAIGYEAGKTNQGINSIAIGGDCLDETPLLNSMSSAGARDQGDYAIAIGTSSGVFFQKENAISIGKLSGHYDQSFNAIAIGHKAGHKYQSENSIAIGNNSGYENQGENSIAIGNNSGSLNQHDNTIILNASDTSLNSLVENALYVNPIREDNGGMNLYYNPETKEVTYRNNLVKDNLRGLNFNGLEIENVSRIQGENIVIESDNDIIISNNVQIVDNSVSNVNKIFPHIDLSLNGILTLETDRAIVNPVSRIGFTFVSINNFYNEHILKNLSIKVRSPNIANSNVVLKNYLELVYSESPYCTEEVIATKTITSKMFNFFDIPIDISFDNLNLKINSSNSSETAPILYFRLKDNGTPLYDIQFLIHEQHSYKDPSNSILSYYKRMWSGGSINITSLIASNLNFVSNPENYMLTVSKIFIDNKGGVDFNHSNIDNITSINSDNNININSKDDLIINSNVIINGYIKNNSGYFANVLGTAKEMFPANECNKALITNLNDMHKYRGAVFAPNGNIYCIPYDSNKILIINSNTYEIKYINNVPINGYSSGVIATNRKIYCAPLKPNNNKILVIDTNNDTIYYLTGLNTVNADQWFGGVLATNDNIYFIQDSHHSVLVLNTINENISYLSNPISGINQWRGGVLGPNGLIYCIPFNSNKVAIINPYLNSNNIYTDIITNVGTINQGNWACGVVGQNGFIYGIPYNNNKILKIDPNNNKFTFVNIDYENSELPEKWIGGTLAPNGTIYMMPFKSPDMLLFDAITETFQISPNVGSGASDWIGSVLVSNGKVFGIPYNNNSVLIIKTGIPFHSNWMIAPEFNKL
jgi:hypothetical protein